MQYREYERHRQTLELPEAEVLRMFVVIGEESAGAGIVCVREGGTVVLGQNKGGAASAGLL